MFLRALLSPAGIALLAVLCLFTPSALLKAGSEQASAGDGPVPLERIVRPDDLMGGKLSPDGKHIAFRYAEPNGSSVTMVVYDCEKKDFTARMGIRPHEDVRTFDWIDDEKIVFRMASYNQYAHGLYLFEPGRRRSARSLVQEGVATVVNPMPHRKDCFMMWKRASRHWDPHLALFNVVYNREDRQPAPGQKMPEGDAFSFATNRDGVAIYALVYDEKTETETFMRYDTEADEWVETPDMKLEDPQVAGVDPADPSYAYVLAYGEREPTRGLYHVNFISGEHERIYADDFYSIDGRTTSLYFAENGTLLGMTYVRDGPRNVWFDEGMKTVQATLDQVYPHCVNVVQSADRDWNRVLFRSYSSTHPGFLTVVDREQKQVIAQFNQAPWLKPGQLQEMKTMRLKMDDGLTLEGYVTPPAGDPPRPWPAVVLVHGGPWARDTWGFDREVQFLASRGYAVLQLNFRGSTGYSREVSYVYEKDIKGMVADVVEGTRKFVEQGFFDPERTGIMGWSFGGYTALQAVATAPDLYACTIGLAGVYDWEKDLKDQDGWAHTFWKDVLGDPETDAEYLRELSPFHHVDRIKVPVFLGHGREDSVVDYNQTKRMAKALRSVDNDPVVRIVSAERHGYTDVENRIKLYEELEEFLYKHMPPTRSARTE